jgi:hypothetical protein
MIEHSFLPAQPTESDGQPSSQTIPTSRRQRQRLQWASRLSEESLRALDSLLAGAVPAGNEKNSLAYSLCLELAANSTKKRLNTSFVTHLMGLPEGWVSSEPTNSAALETWLSRSRERLRFLRS